MRRRSITPGCACRAGGRIVEHQAIGTKLAEIAIKLEVARAAVWQAAWASDHAGAYADRSVADLPLQAMAQVFVSEMMLSATKDAAEVFGAMGVMRDMPMQKYVHDARICLHSGDGNRDAKLRIAEALVGYRRPSDRGRGGGIAFHTHEDVLMDFALSNEQRDWQMTARKFADEEIRPISLARDEIPTAHETFDWEIVRKGSKLGFRTMAVPKEYGGEGTDFVTQALVMAELARADSAISKTFSQNWKWSHLISHACTDEQKARFLKPFVADDTFLLGKGISEPGAGSDNRLPPADDPKAGLKLRAERKGDEWILNGEKCFIANAPVGKLFFIDARTDPAAR